MKNKCIPGGVRAGNDLPVATPEDDRYGFTSLAENLSQSIFALDTDVSTVVGIEGAWGAGKTSLLNLLQLQLKKDKPDNTHIIPISPWLSASGTSSVESLLIPVAAILDKEQEKQYSWLRRLKRKIWSGRASAIATDVLRYAQQASGKIAPLAELASNWVPGFGIAGKIMKTVSTADLSASRQTTAALRADIEKRISDMDLNFVVVLDDLDRLEPEQAVDVLRMVRSVADFSRFRYIMCYDPIVLGHAVEVGLNIKDGQRYLQKIIQLSFSLPRPESFDLRNEFMAGSIQLFEKVNGSEPDYSLIEDIRSVTGTFGAMLNTPREVRLVLGSLAFRYPPLKDSVWFPDLCLLHLLRVTFPSMYDWTEHYLTEYATVASGNGQVTVKENRAIADELNNLMSSLPPASPLSLMELAKWLPGIEGINQQSLKLFVLERDAVRSQADSAKRLRSGFHWRFYFAFSPPKDVLPVAFFEELFDVAGKTDAPSELTSLLFNKMTGNGYTTRWWFDHILDRLTPAMLGQATSVQCRGLLLFLFKNGREVLRRYYDRGEWLTVYSIQLRELADNLLRRLVIDNRSEALALLGNSLTNDGTLNWSVSYLRHLLWQNGLAGNRPANESDRVLYDQDLKMLCAKASVWFECPENRDMLWREDDMSEIIYAWRDINSPERVAAWIQSETRDDGNFLDVLMRLRYDGISSASGRYKGLSMSNMETIFGKDYSVADRLNKIEAEGGFSEQIQQIQDALSHGMD